MHFSDLIIEKANRETPVQVEIFDANPKFSGVATINNLVRIIRTFQRWNCNNDVVCASDFGLGIRTELNGHLLQQEIAGHKVKCHQYKAIVEMCNNGLEVSVSFGDERTLYTLKRDGNIAMITNL